MKKKKIIILSSILGAIFLVVILIILIKNPPHSHVWDDGTKTVEVTCTSDGEMVFTCLECGKEKVEILPAPGHDEVIDESIKETCTESGLTEGSHCSVCNKILIEQEIISAHHNYINDICKDCGSYSEEYYTDGLSFQLLDDEKSYSVSMGRVIDEKVVIPSIYNGYPVTTIKNRAFLNCDFIEEIIISNSITTIGSSAFSGCVSLKTIKMGNSVTSIGYSAFYECSNLTSITIPDCVTVIEDNAFKDCTSLSSIVLSNNLLNIGKLAFKDCVVLESIEIPNSVKTIGEGAFEGCNLISEIHIPDSVESIGIELFGDNNSLIEITVDDNNTTYDSRNNCNAIIESASNTLILGCNNTIIPNSISSIGNNAFHGCNQIKDVIIPDGVISIGYSAFSNCTSLTSILLPQSLESIGAQAFSGCISLVNISLPSKITAIEMMTFYNCNSLENISISENLEYIDYQAFYACVKLRQIRIPYSVTKIGTDAFRYCEELKDVYYEGGSFDWIKITGYYELILKNMHYNHLHASWDVTKIIKHPTCISKGVTIHKCTSCYTEVEEVTPIVNQNHCHIIDFNDAYKCTDCGLSFIKYFVFSGNYNGSYNSYLTSYNLVIDDCMPIDSFIPETYNNMSVVSIVFGSYGDKLFRSIIIPDSVTSIGYKAFYGCSNLTSITIPDSVTSIPDWAFYGCSNLTSITIPDSVTSIGYRAFYGCDSLESITIPFVGQNIDGSGGTHFGYIFGAYDISDNESYVPNNLKEVIITRGTSIDKQAFFGCSNLTSITIPDSVTSIGHGAFEGCSNLTSITIPDSVTSIGSWAFFGCYSLESITIPFVGQNLDGSGETHFGYIFGAYYISDNESYVPNNLKEVIITRGTSIGSRAFEGCDNLTSIVIPDSVTSIGYRAFSGCSNLISITIPDSVTSIGDDAFEGCDSLIYNQYDNGLYLGDEENPYVILIKVSSNSISSCHINDETRFISQYAFSGCSNLTSITIPDSVTSIGSGAFSECDNLTSITLPFIGQNLDGSGGTHFGYIFGADHIWGNKSYVPNNLKEVIITRGTSIDEQAFFGCSNLTSITIPDSVTSIGSGAFSECYNLTSIVIPDSVTSIGSGAFSECYNLKNVYYLGNMEQWYSISIDGNNYYLINATINYGDC